MKILTAAISAVALAGAGPIFWFTYRVAGNDSLSLTNSDWSPRPAYFALKGYIADNKG